MWLDRHLRLLESDYGRDYGWFVEYDNRRLARLLDPKWEDMFWYSYRMEPLSNDPCDLVLLHSNDFWFSDKPVYRNCEFDYVVALAFAGGGDAEKLLRETGRIMMRGLYLHTMCFPWDYCLLWIRRRRRKKHDSAK